MPARLLLISFTFISLMLPASVTAVENFLFRGQIIDTANRPVSGAEVYVFDSRNIKRPADFISNHTGSDGHFRVELPPGKYWALAIMRRSGATFGPLGKDDKHSGEPIEIGPPDKGEITHDFTVMDLQEAARASQKRSETVVRVTGHIIDMNGNPVAMAYVMADTRRRFGRMPSYLSTWTGADGSYTIFLPRGKFFLGTTKDFPPDNDYYLTEEVVLGQDTADIDLTLNNSNNRLN